MAGETNKLQSFLDDFASHNAHTGKQGLKNIDNYVSQLAKFLECYAE